MTPQIIIKIIIGIYAFLAAGFMYTAYWLVMNNIKINITRIKEGTPYSTSVRARIKDNRFYPINDMFGKKHIKNIKYDKVKDTIIMNEGFPYIGVKKVLFLRATVEEIKDKKTKYDEVVNLESFIPSINVKKSKITDTMISWLSTSKKELFLATEPKMTREQVMREIILPMGLVILTVMVLIFFPKIYMSIKAASSESMSGATSQLTSAISKLIPLG